MHGNNQPKMFGTFYRVRDGNKVNEFATTASSKEQLQQRIKEHLQNNKSEEDTEKDHEVAKEPSFESQFESIFENMESYLELSGYITNFIPHIARIRFKRDVVDFAEETFNKVDDYEDFPIYEISAEESHAIWDVIKNIETHSRGSDKIRFSILLSLVSTYDYLLSEFLRFLMMQNPERYEGSDRAYKVGEILKLKSIDEIISRVINDEISQLMNGNHSDQLKEVEKNFHVGDLTKQPDYPDFIEIFERRNLVAHGQLHVNTRYVENCRKAGCKNIPDIGTSVDVDLDYVVRATSLCMRMLLGIVFSIWLKRTKNEHDLPFQAILNASFNLLRSDRHDLAKDIADIAILAADSRCPMQVRQMLIINKAIALKEMGNDDECLALLKGTDFSSSPPVIKVGLASLREDVESACANLQAAALVDKTSLIEVQNWPVFKWIREDPIFIRKCEEVFGEPPLVTEKKIEDDREVE